MKWVDESLSRMMLQYSSMHSPRRMGSTGSSGFAEVSWINTLSLRLMSVKAISLEVAEWGRSFMMSSSKRSLRPKKAKTSAEAIISTYIRALRPLKKW